MLLKRAGYEVYYIAGTGRTGNPHRWLYVKFSDGWYYMDSVYRDGAKMSEATLRGHKCKWDASNLPK